MRKAFVIITLLALYPALLNAQVGGKSTYKFLTLTNSARVASLGGDVISIDDAQRGKRDRDLNFAFHNPAMLDRSTDNQLVTNYVNYFTDINYGYFCYAKSFEQAGNFAFGVHYIDYGDFTRTDYLGTITGNFTASEYAFNLMWSKSLDSMFTVGVNLKPIGSHLDSYRSYGIAADFGVMYSNPKRLLSAGFVLKNVGTQIRAYTEGNYEPLPFDCQIAITKRLAHAPFRFTLLAHHLQIFDLTFENPNNPSITIDPFTGEIIKQSKFREGFDKVMRHVNLGVELLITDNFYFNVGYNHQRKKEMEIETRAGGVGFSWGFGVKLSRFHISYGRATYHLAGASNHFSLSTNFNEFFQKKSVQSNAMY